jgi:D-3-phosphoglycerate dehydrogenase
MRVLATAPYFRPVPERYRKVFSTLGVDVDSPFVAQNMSEADLLAIIDRYDGVIAGDDEFTAKVIERGAKHRLKVIAKWGVGINAIDVAAAERFGVAVRRSPGALSDAVADAALGYVLMLARRLHASDADVRAGRWEKIPGLSLRGRTLGIIGVGGIGQEIARRAVPFGMTLVGNDIREIDASFLSACGMTMMAKRALLAASDFVVLACDLNPTSYHIIAGDDLNAMKAEAFLINVARGALVDTAGAAKALSSGRIAGAAFDVYEEEPLPSDSPLRACPNTLLNSHNAFNADKAVQFVNDNTVRELLRVLLPDVNLTFQVLDQK